MKKLLSLLGIFGLLAFVAMPVFAQQEDVYADDESLMFFDDEFDYGVDEDGYALETTDEDTVEGKFDLDNIESFNDIFEDEEVKNALDEAGLTNEEAAGILGLLLGLGALMIPLAIIGFILWILRIIALWKAYQRAGQGGWEAIVPIYCSYIKYKLAGMKNWFWYGLLIAVVMGIIAAFIPDQQQLLTDIATLIVGIIYVVVKFKFARKYGWGVFASILYVLFNPICVLILGFGNYKYEGESEETVVEA